MSRVGKQILNIPAQVEVDKDTSGWLTVKGPKGQLTRQFKLEVNIVIEDKTVRFEPQSQSIKVRSLWGTYASHVSNMIHGVSEEFTKRLVLEGVGYKVEVQGNTLVLSVGFSHPVKVDIPEDLTVSAEKNTITITGIDKERVGWFAGQVRAIKKPEPYKGKGIRYEGERVILKEGKKSA